MKRGSCRQSFHLESLSISLYTSILYYTVILTYFFLLKCISLHVFSENIWSVSNQGLYDKQELNCLWLFLYILKGSSEHKRYPDNRYKSNPVDEWKRKEMMLKAWAWSIMSHGFCKQAGCAFERLMWIVVIWKSSFKKWSNLDPISLFAVHWVDISCF